MEYIAWYNGTRLHSSLGYRKPDTSSINHVIRTGIVTCPGLPGPQITPYLTREASRDHYAPGTEFAIDRLTLLGNTGTYLDAPYHRYPDGADLSGIALSRT